MKDITYEEFIQNILNTRGRFGCGKEYHERHHIKPRCIGGTDEEENLIDLYASEHFKAHKLLALENLDNKSLVYAYWMMAHIGRVEVSAEEYEIARVTYGATQSKRMQGTKRSDEAKKKLSQSIKGEKNPFYGKSHTLESIKKISEARKGLYSGDKNPRALIVVQFDKKDVLIKIWKYAKLASKELHIDASSISKCAKGKVKSAGGYHWKFLYDNKFNDEVALGAITLGLITEDEALKQLK